MAFVFAFVGASVFQFHKGTIKTCLKVACLTKFLINFNSIKVQLKHFLVLLSVFSLSFQFHKGTIKT